MALYPQELHAGADVFSADGHKLGELQRVVLRRSDLSVTHIVIDIGFLRSGRSIWEGGFGLDYDRIVPVQQVGSYGHDRIDLVLTAEAFKDAPEYTVESFEPPQDLSPDEFDIPDVANRLQGIAALIGSTPNVWLVEKLQQPEGSVEVIEGADVWRRDPHEKLGDVSRVILDEVSGAARALVIKRGALLKHEVVLPMRYVVELADGVVRVDIEDEALGQLRKYED
jgi:uncharacterized protein YrrD